MDGLSFFLRIISNRYCEINDGDVHHRPCWRGLIAFSLFPFTVREARGGGSSRGHRKNSNFANSFRLARRRPFICLCASRILHLASSFFASLAAKISLISLTARLVARVAKIMNLPISLDIPSVTAKPPRERAGVAFPRLLLPRDIGQREKYAPRSR